MGGSSIAHTDVINLLVSDLGISKADAEAEIHHNNCFAVRLKWLRDLFYKEPTNVNNNKKKKSGEERTNIIGTKVSSPTGADQHRARAYLLFLLGSTMFGDTSGGRTPVYILQCLKNLNEISTYAWGVACLAFLYRQLGQASSWTTKQMAGYLPLLEFLKTNTILLLLRPMLPSPQCSACPETNGVSRAL
ncbi:Aminotransferase-like, plant mobile domain family protein [Thalictrum thalictroides]|uniref:Aminotransferase-like, plant mobile domain family protein n=1 Tax=Thalictrum thalictroides TaxID=46969 RepID=A0A7J6WX85_THATH|nr:Aminotransferase-like, plant mobile domain family protein [Thalictrum thalictroides]